MQFTDPTGMFGLSEASAVSNIIGTLTNLQVNNAFNVFSQLGVDDEDIETARTVFQAGSAILLAYGGVQSVRFLAGKNAEKVLKIPGTVRSRVNLINCKTRKGSGRCSEGWEHVIDEHFSGKKGKSQFTISEETLRYLLQSPRIVSKLPKGGNGRYLRTVKLNMTVGKSGKTGSPTKYISVITDGKGNLLTATPGKIGGF